MNATRIKEILAVNPYTTFVARTSRVGEERVYVELIGFGYWCWSEEYKAAKSAHEEAEKAKGNYSLFRQATRREDWIRNREREDDIGRYDYSFLGYRRPNREWLGYIKEDGVPREKWRVQTFYGRSILHTAAHMDRLEAHISQIEAEKRAALEHRQEAADALQAFLLRAGLPVHAVEAEEAAAGVLRVYVPEDTEGISGFTAALTKLTTDTEDTDDGT